MPCEGTEHLSHRHWRCIRNLFWIVTFAHFLKEDLGRGGRLEREGTHESKAMQY